MWKNKKKNGKYDRLQVFFVLLHLPKRTRSLMDRITDSGSVGLGSIPNGCTKKR